MDNSTEKPLVSFVVLAYNQQRFIREAVEGALAQTYSPLEIILSDDCSTDSTFEILRDLVENYKGPHTVILNRNHENLGIGGHVNRCMELSNGGLIVVAAGDDVSVAERTTILCKNWVASKGLAVSLYSDARLIDSNGTELGAMVRNISDDVFQVVQDESIIVGCAHAWDRRVFSFFGPLREDIVAEDVVLPFRSLLLGGVRRVDAKLVSYRQCESEWKRPESKSRKHTLLQITRHKNGVVKSVAYRQMLTDLEKARKHLLPDSEYQKLRALLVLKLNTCNLFVDLIDQGLGKLILYAVNNRRLGRPELRVVKRYLKLRARALSVEGV